MITPKVIDARTARSYGHSMDTERRYTAVEMARAGEIRFAPEDIDPEGLKILGEAGFVWEPRCLAFQRIPAGRPEPRRRSTIEYTFLRDQKLVVNTSLGTQERVGQLQRLRILVQSMD